MLTVGFFHPLGSEGAIFEFGTRVRVVDLHSLRDHCSSYSALTTGLHDVPEVPLSSQRDLVSTSPPIDELLSP